MKLSLAPLCVLILMVACGGHTTTFLPDDPDAESSSSPDDKLDSSVCDGGYNVWRHDPNSWILTSPIIHLVFWSDWWLTTTNGKSTLLTEAETWGVIANDPLFYVPVSEYGVGPGLFAETSITYLDLPIGFISEQAVQDELAKEMQDGSLPNGDNQSIFVIMLPPDTQSQYDVSNHFSGHHGSMNGFTYATIENHANLDLLISHEIYEAATNPDTGNGWWGSGGETEIGDLCEGHKINAWTLDGYTVSMIWSQSQCQCVPN